MGVFENLPYTNFHELNEDWLLKKMKEAVEGYADLANDFAELKTYVENFIDQLDVDAEVRALLEQWLEDGTFDSLIAEILVGYVSDFNQQLDTMNARITNFLTNNQGALQQRVNIYNATVGNDGQTVTLLDSAEKYDLIEVQYSYNDILGTHQFRRQDFTAPAGVAIYIPYTRTTAESPAILRIGKITLKPTGVLNQYEVTSTLWAWTGAAASPGNSAAITTGFSGGQINRIYGIRPGRDAECEDIRVGYDGVTYASAGEAVRAQIEDLHEEITARMVMGWNGKKWLALGDSITIGVNVAVNSSYVIRTANYLGLDVTNKGIGGAGVQRFLENVSNQDILDADLITIYGSINNCNRNGVSVGSELDSPAIDGTLCARWKYIIEQILTVKPAARIVIIGMTPAFNTQYFTGYGPYNSDGDTQRSAEEAIGRVAKYYGIPFVDMYGEAGFNSYNYGDSNSAYSIDGVHPNVNGTRRIANVLIGHLQQLQPFIA